MANPDRAVERIVVSGEERPERDYPLLIDEHNALTHHLAAGQRRNVATGERDRTAASADGIEIGSGGAYAARASGSSI